MANGSRPTNRDLATGVSLAELPAGPALRGRIGQVAVLLVRYGDEIFGVDTRLVRTITVL